MSRAAFDLSGKTALVTGAARGIGQAISKVFAEHGARVMASDVDEAEVIRAAAALDLKHPGCRSVAMDVTDPSSIAEAVSETLRQFGRIDILVNNAGVNTVRDRVTVEKYSLDDWRRILQVDLD